MPPLGHSRNSAQGWCSSNYYIPNLDSYRHRGPPASSSRVRVFSSMTETPQDWGVCFVRVSRLWALHSAEENIDDTTQIRQSKFSTRVTLLSPVATLSECVSLPRGGYTAKGSNRCQNFRVRVTLPDAGNKIFLCDTVVRFTARFICCFAPAPLQKRVRLHNGTFGTRLGQHYEDNSSPGILPLSSGGGCSCFQRGH